jgi:hypothetical protein
MNRNEEANIILRGINLQNKRIKKQYAMRAVLMYCGTKPHFDKAILFKERLREAWTDCQSKTNRIRSRGLPSDMVVC